MICDSKYTIQKKEMLTWFCTYLQAQAVESWATHWTPSDDGRTVSFHGQRLLRHPLLCHIHSVWPRLEFEWSRRPCIEEDVWAYNTQGPHHSGILHREYRSRQQKIMFCLSTFKVMFKEFAMVGVFDSCSLFSPPKQS